MKSKIFFLIVFCFITYTAYAQNFDKGAVDSAIVFQSNILKTMNTIYRDTIQNTQVFADSSGKVDDGRQKINNIEVKSIEERDNKDHSTSPYIAEFCGGVLGGFLFTWLSSPIVSPETFSDEYVDAPQLPSFSRLLSPVYCTSSALSVYVVGRICKTKGSLYTTVVAANILPISVLIFEKISREKYTGAYFWSTIIAPFAATVAYNLSQKSEPVYKKNKAQKSSVILIPLSNANKIKPYLIYTNKF